MATTAPPGDGYWAPDARGGAWQWHSTKTPPPKDLVTKYGLEKLKNRDVNPGTNDPSVHAPAPQGGEPLPYGGYWTPSRKGWVWVPAPDGRATIVTTGGKSKDQFTDPTRNPDGIKVDNKDYKGEFLPDGSRNPYFIAPDVNAPKLTSQPGWPRDVTGTPTGTSGSGGGSTSGPPPSHSEFRINIADGREMERRIVTEAEKTRAVYDELVAKVATEKDWIFTVRDANVLTQQRPKGGGAMNVDPHPVQTAQMRSSMDNLLLAVGDAITATGGTYVGTLDNAFQLYAKADKDSFLPTD